MDEQNTQTEMHDCAHPDCKVGILDGHGATCHKHESWFAAQIGSFNAGVPSDETSNQLELNFDDSYYHQSFV